MRRDLLVHVFVMLLVLVLVLVLVAGALPTVSIVSVDPFSL